jgi:hypothetical protein
MSKPELTPEQKAAKDKARRAAISGLYLFTGFAATSVGIAMFSIPVALICGGILLLAAATADIIDAKHNKG